MHSFVRVSLILAWGPPILWGCGSAPPSASGGSDDLASGISWRADAADASAGQDASRGADALGPDQDAESAGPVPWVIVELEMPPLPQCGLAQIPSLDGTCRDVGPAECPEGFSEAGLQGCLPMIYGCEDAGTVRVAGECAAVGVGAACPHPEFVQLASSPGAVHVDVAADAGQADGSEVHPFTHPAAAVESGAAVVVVHPGVYELAAPLLLPAGVTMQGACAGTTILTGDLDELVQAGAPGPATELAGLTLEGGASGLAVTTGASVIGRDLVLRAAAEQGLRVDGATLELVRVWVGDMATGVGLQAISAAVVADRVEVTGVERGVEATDSELTLDRVRLDHLGGRGVSLLGGAAELHAVEVVGAQKEGVRVDDGGHLTLNASTVRQTERSSPELTDGSGVFGGSQTQLSVTDSLIFESGRNGIVGLGGLSVTGTSVLDSDRFGVIALSQEPDDEVLIEGVTVAVAAGGIALTSAASTVRRSVVRDGRPDSYGEFETQFGIGIAKSDTATIELHATVEGCVLIDNGLKSLQVQQAEAVLAGNLVMNPSGFGVVVHPRPGSVVVEHNHLLATGGAGVFVNGEPPEVRVDVPPGSVSVLLRDNIVSAVDMVSWLPPGSPAFAVMASGPGASVQVETSWIEVEEGSAVACLGASWCGVTGNDVRVTKSEVFTGIGVECEGGGAEVSDNRIVRGGGTGIEVRSCVDAVVSGNAVQDSLLGMFVCGSHGAHLAGNVTAKLRPGYELGGGLYVRDAEGVVVEGGVSASNPGVGAWISGGSVTLLDTRISGNAGGGLVAEAAALVVLSGDGNVVSDNEQSGVHCEDATLTIEGGAIVDQRPRTLDGAYGFGLLLEAQCVADIHTALICGNACDDVRVDGAGGALGALAACDGGVVLGGSGDPTGFESAPALVEATCSLLPKLATLADVACAVPEYVVPN